MKYVASIFFMFFILGGAGGAYAFCSNPSFYSNAPDPPYGKPSAPFCLSGYKFSGTHECDSWEIDSYIDDINRYIRELGNYVDEAVSFANEAASFANEAANYAECESREAQSELR
jgi:hypothetical protein